MAVPSSIAAILLSLIVGTPMLARQTNVIDGPHSKPEPFPFPERLEGDFTQIGEMPLSGGKETTTIAGHVVWRIKLDQGLDQLPLIPSSNVKAASDLREYEAVSLKLSLRVSGSASGQIGICQHDGSLEVTPTVEERRQLAMTIDSASQAAIRLALIKTDVTYDVKYTCHGTSGIKVPPMTQHEHGLTVSLGGLYVSPLVDGKIVGQTKEPIQAGPQTITGSWKFVVAR